MGKPSFLVSLAAVLCIITLAQQNPAASTAMDSFLGKWKLSVEKSSPGPTAGTFTIEPDGKKFKITLEMAYPSGPGGTSWTVTDMKGSPTPVTRTSNRLITEEWLVKREAADTFTIVSIFRAGPTAGRVEWRYTIGSDGKTLTRRFISGAPRTEQNQVLVFEKAP